MAGHALRYDQEWYYRHTNAQWFFVRADLPAGADIRAQDRVRVTSPPELMTALAGLYDDVQASRLPDRLRPGLLLAIPAALPEITDALSKRPKKGTALK